MADKKISALTAATTPLGGTEVFPIVQSSATVKATIADVQAAPVSAGTANGVQYLNASKVPTTGAVFTFDGYTPIVNFASNQIGYRAIGSTNGTNPDAGSNRGGVVQLQNNDTTDGNGNAVEFYNSNSLTSSYINGINVSHSGRTGAIVFGVANGGAPAEKWRINATGNLVVSTSGNGIDFSATPGTGTSELFSDYEEGTWTPAFSASGLSGITYLIQQGTYTKIGRAVYVVFYVATSGTFTSGSAAVTITGLPFTSASTNTSHVGFANATRWLTAPVSGRISSSTTSIDIYSSYNTVGVGSDPVAITGLGMVSTDGGNNNIIQASAMYFV